VTPSVAVDTSALMAILLGEPDADRYFAVLADTAPMIALATRVELGCVARRKIGPTGIAEAEGLLGDLGVTSVAMDERQALVALEAMARYGKGRGEIPSALNYGDLFSYALAKSRDLPLLYKGDDFSRTDVRSALAELGA
jgi:ribonuclease VapC